MINLVYDWVKRRKNFILIFVILFLVCDIFTSSLGWYLGIPEFNPFLKMAQGSFNFILLKMIGTVVILSGFFFLYRKYKRVWHIVDDHNGKIGYNQNYLKLEMITWGMILGISLFIIMINIVGIFVFSTV